MVNNTNNKELFHRIAEMKLAIGKYALFGSAPMGVRGMKECSDIDLIVCEEVWEVYKNKPEWNYKITENGVEHIESQDGKIELWHDWRPWYEDGSRFINDAEIIDGLPFVRLNYVLEWKKKFGRGKDLKDIETIEKFLADAERNIKSVMGRNIHKIALALNLPWSLVGFIYGLILLPRSIKIDKSQLVMVVKVRRLWANEIFLGWKVRGFTLGNTVLLSNVANDSTYDHEIVHVRQFTKVPFVFPLLYCLEFVKNGYKDNKYEKEACWESNKSA